MYAKQIPHAARYGKNSDITYIHTHLLTLRACEVERRQVEG